MAFCISVIFKVVLLRATWVTFKPKLKKIKKIHSKKIPYFPEIELASSNIKKVLILSQKKVFVIFSQKKGFFIFSQKKTFPKFSEMNPSPENKRNPPREQFLILQEMETAPKFAVLSKKKVFLIYLETETLKKILIFQEVTCNA